MTNPEASELLDEAEREEKTARQWPKGHAIRIWHMRRANDLRARSEIMTVRGD